VSRRDPAPSVRALEHGREALIGDTLSSHLNCDDFSILWLRWVAIVRPLIHEPATPFKQVRALVRSLNCIPHAVRQYHLGDLSRAVGSSAAQPRALLHAGRERLRCKLATQVGSMETGQSLKHRVREAMASMIASSAARRHRRCRSGCTPCGVRTWAPACRPAMAPR
jgi:hypothetical protein